MSEKPVISKLLETTPELWRGRQPNRGQRSLPSGHARLDACLPGGGWPLGAVEYGRTRWFRTPERAHSADTPFDLAKVESLPRVVNLYAHANLKLSRIHI